MKERKKDKMQPAGQNIVLRKITGIFNIFFRKNVVRFPHF